MIPPRILLLLCLSLFVTACAQVAVTAPAATTSVQRPFTDRDQEIAYHVFMGELASRRGERDMATQEYLAAAKQSEDPALAARATILAYGSRDDTVALEAALRWQTLAPKDADAGHFVAVLYARRGKVAESAAGFESLMQSGIDRGYTTVARLLEQETDAAHGLPVLERMVADAPRSADAHYALAHAALSFHIYDQAVRAARAAIALDPQADDARLVLGRALVGQGHPDEAVSLLEARVRAAPDDAALHLAFAALLAEAGRDKAARGEFDAVLKLRPTNGEALYTAGLLAMQDKDLPAARNYFDRLLKSGHRSDDALYFLGSVAELAKRYPEALDWYHKVGDGERWLAAQTAIGRTLVESGTPDAAQAFFDQLVEDDGDDSIVLRLAEGEALSTQGETGRALKVYDDALTEQPDSDDLLYARALVREQRGDADQALDDLQALVKRAPSDAQALNALGYTLTLHTTRYQEAQGYIAKALLIEPDDPAIMDSMGWVEFRLGDVVLALGYLQKAYTAQADPEIAAHLIEVLLTMGDTEVARGVWQNALKADPEDTTLRGFAARFTP